MPGICINRDIVNPNVPMPETCQPKCELKTDDIEKINDTASEGPPGSCDTTTCGCESSRVFDDREVLYEPLSSIRKNTTSATNCTNVQQMFNDIVSKISPPVASSDTFGVMSSSANNMTIKNTREVMQDIVDTDPLKDAGITKLITPDDLTNLELKNNNGNKITNDSQLNASISFGSNKMMDIAQKNLDTKGELRSLPERSKFDTIDFPNPQTLTDKTDIRGEIDTNEYAPLPTLTNRSIRPSTYSAVNNYPLTERFSLPPSMTEKDYYQLRSLVRNASQYSDTGAELPVLAPQHPIFMETSGIFEVTRMILAKAARHNIPDVAEWVSPLQSKLTISERRQLQTDMVNSGSIMAMAGMYYTHGYNTLPDGYHEVRSLAKNREVLRDQSHRVSNDWLKCCSADLLLTSLSLTKNKMFSVDTDRSNRNPDISSEVPFDIIQASDIHEYGTDGKFVEFCIGKDDADLITSARWLFK